MSVLNLLAQGITNLYHPSFIPSLMSYKGSHFFFVGINSPVSVTNTLKFFKKHEEIFTLWDRDILLLEAVVREVPIKRTFSSENLIPYEFYFDPVLYMYKKVFINFVVNFCEIGVFIV